MSKKKYRTDFLFSKSNFLMGMGSVLDLSGTYYTFNASESEKEADRKAIESDWGMIGQDMKEAMGIVCKDVVKK